MKSLIVASGSIGVLIAAWIWYQTQPPGTSASPGALESPRIVGISESLSKKLTEDPKRTDIFSSLAYEDQNALVRIVIGQCSKQYHADSCIYYVTKCGRPCLAHISTEERSRMLLDYQALRRQHGLKEI